MPVVKLVSCLKRYCQPKSWIGLPPYWSDDEISHFVQTVVDAIPDDGIKDRI